jgi:hypothetical protein
VARTAGVGADLQDLAADDKPGFDVFAEARVLRRLGMAVFVIGVCVIAVGVGAVGFVCVSAAFDGFISTQHVLERCASRCRGLSASPAPWPPACPAA